MAIIRARYEVVQARKRAGLQAKRANENFGYNPQWSFEDFDPSEQLIHDEWAN